MSYNNPELYIQLRDGQPYEHPILADNFREAFPDVDTTTFPNEHFARFVRLPRPKNPRGQVYDHTTYEWDGDVVTDVHHFRDITDEEREAQKAQVIEEAIKFKAARIEFINEMLNAGFSEAGHSLWAACLEKHQSWMTDETQHPSEPVPAFPYKDENGNWVAPAS